MFIKTRMTRVAGVEGRELERARTALGIDRDRAARILGLSVVRLYLLESGEAEMEDPAMWPAARLILMKAASGKEPDDGAR